MRNILQTLILSLCITSCTKYNHINHPISKKQELATQVRKNVANRLENEKGLSPCGIGAQMMDKIQMLSLSFQYYKPLSIEEARELLIYSTNQFIREVNENNEIRNYLANYPFTFKNIDIRIFLHGPSGGDVNPNELSAITMQEGVLIYDIDNSTTKHLETILTETYEEAVEKLKIKDAKETVVSSESDRKLSKEDWERLSKSMGFVSGDGSLWSPNENGNWVQDPK